MSLTYHTIVLSAHGIIYGFGGLRCILIPEKVNSSQGAKIEDNNSNDTSNTGAVMHLNTQILGVLNLVHSSLGKNRICESDFYALFQFQSN